ncbi:Hypothetical protein ORPV_156 [Orpheovirus IHUMI-LCC2]|uniref:Uncharacterized protein n=1 Tax=Orpheovirus IHUMI-LCC2 TaxID=2023057 RepID=A0A2I2L3G8_9VIRU|nr:Hypothetical protein ORPV_156 [Orpheovirus IHUMI-LCC2]SNW62060.1 Hypothetical protein ORPV_156 [Orpheovirus IHUMI-LCC2]
MESYKDTDVALDIQNRTGKNVIIIRKVGSVYFNLFKEVSEIVGYIRSLNSSHILFSDNYMSMNLVGGKCIIEFINNVVYEEAKYYLQL